MKNIFQGVALPRVGGNRFNLSHNVKMSFNMGDLVPSLCMEALPGDRIDIGCEQMLRFQPMLAPVMHDIDVKMEYFFVPNRLLWANWEDFITGGSTGTSSPTTPKITLAGSVNSGSLADYLGIEVGLYANGFEVSALQFAAYCLIYDEYYRQQDIHVVDKFVPLTDGDNSGSYLTIAEGEPFKRAWKHDYFTSCLPYAQKGDEILMPITDTQKADVVLKSGTQEQVMKKADGTATTTTGTLTLDVDGHIERGTDGDIILDPNGSLEVDLSNDVVSLNVFRRLQKIQQWLETNARAGSRYIESIWGHFQQKSSDARMQRPEYIGGVHSKMVISEVLTNSHSPEILANGTIDTDSWTSAATMRGHAINVSGGNRLSFKCEEHGFIIGIASVAPKPSYQQGIHRMWTRNDKFDYAWPLLANIGEQPVYVKELYANPSSAIERDEIFGYQQRYAEYKYMNNRVAGDFAGTLDFWHFGRQFGSKPTLNTDFIECNPSERPFALETTDDHKVLGHMFHNIKMYRKLPFYGMPQI